MRKFIIIIIVLVIVFIAMVIHKNITVNKDTINIEEIEKIEKYINQIYLEKEIVGESLPRFDNINNANEKWIWEVTEKNIEDDQIHYEQIQEKSKEIFGENLQKEFPKEGTEYLTYNEAENTYEGITSEIDNQGSLFLLNKIEKIQDGYEIDLIEYLEDYSAMLKEEPEDYIIIKNLNEEEISRTMSSDEEEGINIVKRNLDRFSSKKIILKIKDEKIYIQEVR